MERKKNGPACILSIRSQAPAGRIIIQWRGVLHEAHNRYMEAKSDSYKRKMMQN